MANPNSNRIFTSEPIRNNVLDMNTGIQKALPTCRCLIDL